MMEEVRKISLYEKEHFQQFQRTIEGYKIIYMMSSYGWESKEFVNEYLANLREEKYILTQSNFLEDEIECIIQGHANKKLLLVVTEFEYLIKSNQLETGIQIIKDLPKNIRVLLISSLPLPPELVPFTLERTLVRVGEQEIKPGPEEVRTYFRKQGVVLSSREIERINVDFDNMPLCIYLLVDFLKESFYGYSKHIKKQCWEEVYAYMDMVFFQPLGVEVQNMLLQLSYFKQFSKTLLEFVFSMGGKESENILIRVYNHGSILKECGDGNYCFYPLMSRFLQRYIEKYVSISEREEIYKRAVKYYMDEGDYKETLHFLAILKEERRLADYLAEVTEELNIIRCKELEEYFELLPERTILKYPVLIAGKAILECCKGDKTGALKWYHILEQLNGEENGKKLTRYLDFLMPIHEEFDVIKALGSGAGKKYIGRTDQIPSLIHGGLDFSLCSEQYVKVVEAAEKSKWQDGQESGMLDILKGEIAYEKNDFSRSISNITKGIKIAMTRENIDLVFVGRGILCNIMLHSNQNTSVNEALNYLEEMLEGKETSALYVNYQALVTGCYMAENNLDLIELWMKRWAPDENQEFCILQQYQYLIKVKAYLSLGRNVNAQQLLNILKSYVADFDKPYLKLKTYILESILHYRRDNNEWEECLEQALKLGEEMGFIRVFADEGAAIYPLLEEKRSDEEWKGNPYFTEVLRAAKRTMLFYPLYLEDKKDVGLLTRSETQVLNLLMYGKKNKEIAKILMVSENTVKYHLKNIYIKLGVSNRSQAIRMAAQYEKAQNYLYE